MSLTYLKLIYIFNICIILFIFLLGRDISADQTATIIADEIRSDNNNDDEVSASGNVIILNNDGTKIRADKINYDKQKQKVDANDNVVINDLDGNTYFLDEVEASKGINYLEGSNVKARMYDDSRIVSKDIVKKDNIILLTDAEYTPCKEDNYLIENCPAWKLKANKIYQDMQ